jgi:adenylate kinase
VSRPDDNHEAVRARLADYHTKTAPTLELFHHKGLIVRVAGTLPADTVYQELRRQLGLPACGGNANADQTAAHASASTVNEG